MPRSGSVARTAGRCRASRARRRRNMATPVSDFAIATTGLSKQYRGGVLAVDQVDLRVARGEIYAFLGLNGAGKSTTIRMLLGMIRPTAGHAELFGERVASGATDLWRRVGHLVESATAYQELTVRENLDIARQLAGMPDASEVDRVLERLALAAIRGSTSRHAFARQSATPRPCPCAAPVARAARPR